MFVYYHVELDDHSLILAENTPAETFVDNVDRLNFDNWAEHEALYPEGKPIVELPYPRAKSRRQVPVDIRVAIAARAEAMGAVEAHVGRLIPFDARNAAALRAPPFLPPAFWSKSMDFIWEKKTLDNRSRSAAKTPCVPSSSRR